MGTWLGGLKDLKATIQEVHGYLEDKVIVPESGGRPHAFPPLPLPLPLPLYVCLASFTTCTCVGMPRWGP